MPRGAGTGRIASVRWRCEHKFHLDGRSPFADVVRRLAAVRSRRVWSCVGLNRGLGLPSWNTCRELFSAARFRACLVPVMSTGTRLAYLSDGWFAMLAEESNRAFGECSNTVSIVERYSGAPCGAWRYADRLPGFRIDFRAGASSVRPGAFAGEQGDVVVDVSWENARRLVSMPGSAELTNFMAELGVSGALKVAGDLSLLPFDPFAFHDAVVARTNVDAANSRLIGLTTMTCPTGSDAGRRRDRFRPSMTDAKNARRNGIRGAGKPLQQDK